MKQFCVGLFLIAAMAGCARVGGATANPTLGGVPDAREVRPYVGIGYSFTGGTGSANWTSSGKHGACHGTLSWNAVSVQMYIFPPTGKIDPSSRNDADIEGSGTATCNGQTAPFSFLEAFNLTGGGLTEHGSAVDVTGDPISTAIHGSFSIQGPLCDATIKLLSYRTKQNGDRIDVDASTIEHVKRTIGC